MNDLSWLLYAADVCDNLDWLFFLCMLIAVIGGFMWCFVGCAMAADHNPAVEDWKTWRKVGWGLLLPAFFFGCIMGSIVPSKETVYAIAASEMGEKALNTQTGNKAVKALDSWLDRQITPSQPTNK